MRFYRYRPDSNNFAGIGFSQADGQRIVRAYFTDGPLADGWAIPEALGFDDAPEAAGDFPSLSHFYRVPAVSPSAWDALRPLIGRHAEALPFTMPTGQTFHILHVMAALPALDAARSELTRNAATDRVSRIWRYAFRRELLGGRHAFRLPLDDGGELIVDEEFRGVVEANGLRGLVFEELPVVP